MSPADYDRILVVNNAAWCIGEITQKMRVKGKSGGCKALEMLVEGGQMVRIVNAFGEILNQDIMEQLSQKDKVLLSHFAKTVAITLGRLCLVDAKQLAYCLPRIIKPWCIALRYIRNSDEKVQAFKGLCAMIPYNPTGIADSFPQFCQALVDFQNPPEDLE